MNAATQLARTLWQDRWRTLLSVLAIAAAVVLLLVLEGFQVGLYRQIREYPARLDVPLVATQAGVRNMTGARSIVPLEVVPQVSSVPGVRAVHPVVGLPIVYAQGDDKTPIYVVAYQGRGGPTALRRGRAIRAPREIVIDQGLARKYGLAPGDPFELAGVAFTVSGVSAGSSNVFNPYVYISLDDALSLYAAAREHIDAMTGGKIGVSFLLLDLDDGSDPAAVRRSLEASVPEIDVHTPAELGDNDAAMARQLLGGVVTLLVVVAYIVGILVIGLTLYASVFERMRDFGVMKALGSSNRRLYRSVAAEALTLVALSLVLGLAVSLAVAKAISLWAPQYLVVPWSAAAITRTAIAAVVMAGAAALLPIRQVANVDPAMVFKR